MEKLILDAPILCSFSDWKCMLSFFTSIIGRDVSLTFQSYRNSPSFRLAARGI
jgi:hypothetical protein